MMVEGGDRTDRPVTGSGAGDYGREPDGPEELEWNGDPECSPKPAWQWDSFPAPRLDALQEVVQNAIVNSW